MVFISSSVEIGLFALLGIANAAPVFDATDSAITSFIPRGSPGIGEDLTIKFWKVPYCGNIPDGLTDPKTGIVHQPFNTADLVVLAEFPKDFANERDRGKIPTNGYLTQPYPADHVGQYWASVEFSRPLTINERLTTYTADPDNQNTNDCAKIAKVFDVDNFNGDERCLEIGFQSRCAGLDDPDHPLVPGH